MSVTAKDTRASRVSRETLSLPIRQRLEIIVAQIRKWQPHINLVASSTLDQIWERHIDDSLQICHLVPEARHWIDLGSGGGFPGLVVAASLMDRNDFHMVLVESNGKKCAFLRETARLAALPVTVLHGRIEMIVSTLKQSFDVVSARAVASFEQLLVLSEPLLAKGAVGIFPKGQDVDDELAHATMSWSLVVNLIHSQTEPNARIVLVRSASRKGLQA